MTRQEAADYLGVSTKAIQRYTTRGKLHLLEYRTRPDGAKEAIYDDNEVKALKATMTSGAVDTDSSETVGQVDSPADTILPVPVDSRQIESNGQALVPQGNRQVASRRTAGHIGQAVQLSIGQFQQLIAAIETEVGKKKKPEVEIDKKMILTPAEAAAIAGLPVQDIRLACRDKKLEADRKGRNWRILRSDLNQFVESRAWYTKQD